MGPLARGIGGYLVGKLVTVSLTILAYLVILLVLGLFIVDGLDLGRPYSWLTLAWVLLLGLTATQSIGMMVGALMSSPRGLGMRSAFLPGSAAAVEIAQSWRHLETVAVPGAVSPAGGGRRGRGRRDRWPA